MVVQFEEYILDSFGNVEDAGKLMCPVINEHGLSLSSTVRPKNKPW